TPGNRKSELIVQHQQRVAAGGAAQGGLRPERRFAVSADAVATTREELLARDQILAEPSGQTEAPGCRKDRAGAKRPIVRFLQELLDESHIRAERGAAVLQGRRKGVAARGIHQIVPRVDESCRRETRHVDGHVEGQRGVRDGKRIERVVPLETIPIRDLPGPTLSEQLLEGELTLLRHDRARARTQLFAGSSQVQVGREVPAEKCRSGQERSGGAKIAGISPRQTSRGWPAKDVAVRQVSRQAWTNAPADARRFKGI